MVQNGTGMAERGSTILGTIRDKLGGILTPLRQFSQFLGVGATSISNVETTLNAVTVPVVSPSPPQTLQVSITGNMVQSISLHEHPMEIANVGFKIYGPEIDYTLAPLTASIGPVQVITGFQITETHPLAPVGQAFGVAGQKLSSAKAEVDSIVVLVEDTKNLTNDAKTMVDDLVKQVLHPLPAQLEDVRQKVIGLSTSPLLVIGPFLLLAYFGVIHLAFALTGIAFLFV